MWTDPIVEEIHAVRREIAVECGGNSRALADYFLKKQAEMAGASNAKRGEASDKKPASPTAR
jgi:hypothetical protein